MRSHSHTANGINDLTMHQMRHRYCNFTNAFFFFGQPSSTEIPLFILHGAFFAPWLLWRFFRFYCSYGTFTYIHMVKAYIRLCIVCTLYVYLYVVVHFCTLYFICFIRMFMFDDAKITPLNL